LNISDLDDFKINMRKELNKMEEKIKNDFNNIFSDYDIKLNN
jgi:hypothetical protein